MSRAEQSGVDPSDGEVQDALVRGNRAYEARFGRVFLIRAAGRDAREILASLSERLEHTPEQEERIVAEQLREIALLRLKGMMEA
jgi:2-oxo-4-hydroxy-4-carboxy-5-ureidoimidazoline decarboxylase